MADSSGALQWCAVVSTLGSACSLSQPSGTGQDCLPHLLCGADVLLSSFQLIQKGTKLVLEQVVTSIASVADTAEENLSPTMTYSYHHWSTLSNAVQKELRLLRGKTIECISLIGLAVGKEKVSDLSTMCWVCCVSSGFGGIRGFFLSDKRFSEDLTVFHHLILVLLYFIYNLLPSFFHC